MPFLDLIKSKGMDDYIAPSVEVWMLALEEPLAASGNGEDFGSKKGVWEYDFLMQTISENA